MHSVIIKKAESLPEGAAGTLQFLNAGRLSVAGEKGDGVSEHVPFV